jgi:hypothetical protein
MRYVFIWVFQTFWTQCIKWHIQNLKNKLDQTIIYNVFFNGALKLALKSRL